LKSPGETGRREKAGYQGAKCIKRDNGAGVEYRLVLKGQTSKAKTEKASTTKGKVQKRISPERIKKDSRSLTHLARRGQ